MAGGQKIIYVYDDFTFDTPLLLGRLYAGSIKGGECFSFEYDTEWLKRTALPVDIDPELPAFMGRHFPNGKNIFGLFADSAPDRWAAFV